MTDDLKGRLGDVAERAAHVLIEEGRLTADWTDIALAVDGELLADAGLHVEIEETSKGILFSARHAYEKLGLSDDDVKRIGVRVKELMTQ